MFSFKSQTCMQFVTALRSFLPPSPYFLMVMGGGGGGGRGGGQGRMGNCKVTGILERPAPA